jgi:hypothetical protein
VHRKCYIFQRCARWSNARRSAPLICALTHLPARHLLHFRDHTGAGAALTTNPPIPRFESTACLLCLRLLIDLLDVLPRAFHQAPPPSAQQVRAFAYQSATSFVTHRHSVSLIPRGSSSRSFRPMPAHCARRMRDVLPSCRLPRPCAYRAYSSQTAGPLVLCSCRPEHPLWSIYLQPLHPSALRPRAITHARSLVRFTVPCPHPIH